MAATTHGAPSGAAERARARTPANFPLADEHRVAEGLDIWVIPNFASECLGFDAVAAQAVLESSYSARGAGAEIEPAAVQWVDGDHPALKYRGNVLKRGKIWLQIDDPLTAGYLRYFYTGWQWKVLPATASVDKCPEVKPAVVKYNEWAEAVGFPAANHFIVTKYEDGEHNIGFHYDKPRDIAERSLITVVKMGAHGRPFALRHRKDDQQAQAAEPPFFNKVLEPGTAVIMTLEANLKTQHAVPVVEGECGSSGSIVFRTITKRVPADELDRQLARKRARE